MKKITFIISSLEQGGAQRTLTYLANFLSKDYTVEIITFDKPAQKPFFSLQKQVKVQKLNLFKPQAGIIKRLQELRKAVIQSNPNIIISFLDITNVTTLLATMGLRIATIVCERSDPRKHYIPWVYRVFRKLLYPLAAKIVVQTNDVKAYFNSNNVIIIPNILETPTKITSPKTTKRFITISRLSEHKGVDLLIKAFIEIKNDLPEWRLEIFGDGPYKPTITEHLRGATNDVWQTLSEGGIFVFPSMYEGYPNACIEALAAGLPVIASECNGVKDVIVNDYNGILVPVGDIKALSKDMKKLAKNPQKMKAIASHAQEIIAAHSPEKIYPMWLAIINHKYSSDK